MKLLSILLAVASLWAAASAQSEPPVVGGDWRLASLSIGGRQAVPVAGSETTVAFLADGTLTGYGGCNSFSGTYRIEGERLIAENIISTRRACPDSAVMAQESALLSALGSASSIEVRDDSLVIVYGRGEQVTLTRAFGLVGTLWRLDSQAGIPPVAGSEPTLQFVTDARAGGSSGCNTYGIGYALSDGGLTFQPPASTRRACSDALNAQEAAFFTALQAVTGYSATSEQLVLFYGPQSRLVFSRVLELANTSWRLTSLASEAVPDAAGITLDFDRTGGVTGSGGCKAPTR